MEANRKTITFSILGIALLYFFYSVRSVLSPFVIGMIVAYLLDPIVDKMEDKGINRGFATSIIIIIFFTIIIGLATIIIPIIFDQIIAFLRKMPEYIEFFDNKVQPIIEKAKEGLGVAKTQSEGVNGYIDGSSEKVLEISRRFIKNLLSSSMGIISAISMLLIMPITAFYMLKDWDHIVANINKNLPKKYSGTIKKIFTEVDRTVSCYIRGQIQVCLMLGLFYGIALTVVGLEFGFLIGLVTGVLTFVPYVGMLIGVIVGLVVGFFQYGLD
jgi:predicted PurR-regulated permease PerM